MRKLISQKLKKKEKLLTFYLTAGYPNWKKFFDVLECLISGGMDILELGIPNPNPELDGKTISQTHKYVLDKNFKQKNLFNYLTEIKNRYPQLPLILMTYQNIIDKYDLLDHSDYYDGLLCPDKTLKRVEVPTVQIYKQTMSDKEINKKLSVNQGFAYVISGQTQTGSRGKLPNSYRQLLSRIRKRTSLPIQVGFGIYKSEQVKEVLSAGADGVIIGSEIIRKINKSKIELSNYVQKLNEVRNEVR